MKKIIGYHQYKNDIFNKLAFQFEPGKKILDVCWGDAGVAEIFMKEFELDVYVIDVYRHENVGKISGFKFQQGDIFKIPFEDHCFDYVFLHDILHHIDEKNQAYENHIRGLSEIKRVTKKNGIIATRKKNNIHLHFIGFVMCAGFSGSLLCV